jgi:GNAT superfamily N-acetyltransferase
VNRGWCAGERKTFERVNMLRFVSEHWPNWLDEAAAAYSRVPPSMYIALERDEPVGFACYHAARTNFFGPTAVLESHRRRGIGGALLGVPARPGGRTVALGRGGGTSVALGRLSSRGAKPGSTGAGQAAGIGNSPPGNPALTGEGKAVADRASDPVRGPRWFVVERGKGA